MNQESIKVQERPERPQRIVLAHEVSASMPFERSEVVTLAIRHEDGREELLRQRVQQGQCLVLSIGGVR